MGRKSVFYTVIVLVFLRSYIASIAITFINLIQIRSQSTVSHFVAAAIEMGQICSYLLKHMVLDNFCLKGGYDE